MEKTKINLDIILPDIPDESDACVQRIINELQGRNGIDKVHVVAASLDTEAQLCFHYDPAVITIDKVKRLAAEAGAKITNRYHHLVVDVTGIRHARHARIIERDLRSNDGVLSVDASASGIVMIEFDTQSVTEEQVLGLVKKEGLYLRKKEEHKHGAKESMIMTTGMKKMDMVIRMAEYLVKIQS